MRFIWNTIGAVIITVIVLNIMLDMLRPYVPLIVVSTLIVVGANYTYNRHRNW